MEYESIIYVYIYIYLLLFIYLVAIDLVKIGMIIVNNYDIVFSYTLLLPPLFYKLLV